MSTYRITYKKTGVSLELPEEVSADGYRTQGRFFEFYNDEHGPLGELMNRTIVVSVSSDLVAFVLTK